MSRKEEIAHSSGIIPPQRYYRKAEEGRRAVKT